MKHRLATFTAGLAFALGAGSAQAVIVDETTRAQAVIVPSATAPLSDAPSGSAVLTEPLGSSVRLAVTLQGLERGMRYAVRIHDRADCPPARSPRLRAGAEPEEAPRSSVPATAAAANATARARIVGRLVADERGQASATLVVQDSTLGAGALSLVGRVVTVDPVVSNMDRVMRGADAPWPPLACGRIDRDTLGAR